MLNVNARSQRALVMLHFVDSVGKGVFLSGGTLYFLRVSGLSAAQIGWALSLSAVAGLVATLTLGQVADRIGPRVVLASMLMLQALGFACYPLAPNFALLMVAVILVGFGELGGGPAFGSYVSELHEPDQRVHARAVLRTAFNVGFSLGSGVAAIAAFAGDAWLSSLPLVAAIFLAGSALCTGLLPHVAPTGSGGAVFTAARDVRYLTVILLQFPLALHYSMLIVGIPLWLSAETDLPDGFAPAMLIVNTVLAVLFQIPLSKNVKTTEDARLAARTASCVIAVSCLTLSLTGTVNTGLAAVALVVAVGLLTLGEIRQGASAWGLAHGLAPDSSRAEYLGTFNLYSVVQGIVGPILISTSIGSLGAFGWILPCILILVAGFLTPWAVTSFVHSRIDSMGDTV